jgi:hypothetical protein
MRARSEYSGFRRCDGIGPLARSAINLMPSEVVSPGELSFLHGRLAGAQCPAAARREDQLASISDPHIRAIGFSFAQGHRPHDNKEWNPSCRMILQFPSSADATALFSGAGAEGPGTWLLAPLLVARKVEGELACRLPGRWDLNRAMAAINTTAAPALQGPLWRFVRSVLARLIDWLPGPELRRRVSNRAA